MPKHAPRGPIKVHPMDPAHPMELVRCTATNRQGERCGKSPEPGASVCRMHGGAAPQVQAKALERLKALQPKAITVLESLLDRTEFPTVQMAAVRDVLDRTEGKAGESQSLTIIGQINIVDVLRQRTRRKSEIEENIEQSAIVPQAGDNL